MSGVSSDYLLVDFVRPPGEIVVILLGELDLGTAPLLERALERALSERSEPREELVFDMSQLSFADLRGLETIECALRNERSEGGAGVVLGASPMAMRIARLAGLSEIEAACHWAA